MQTEDSPSFLPTDATVHAVKNGRILFVDDNAEMRLFVRTLLSDRFDILCVADGEQAWQFLLTQEFDLVLSDLMMPRVDGVMLLRALRGHERLGAMPFILVSGRGESEAKSQSFEEGADDYLAKPFGARELTARIEGTLKLARMRKEAGRREEVMRSEAEASHRTNRLREEFLATVSHELRTPVHVIHAYSELLAGLRPGSEEFSRAVGAIRRNAVAQNQIIEDLLDVSRIVTGKLALLSMPVHFTRIVRDAIECVMLAADAKEVSLKVALDVGADSIIGDPNRLQQIVWNLFNNALKFTPRGGSITVTLVRKGMNAELIVRDTGEGIDSSFLPYVFDPFRQQCASISREHGGMGIGLSIVREIALAHGGSVGAASEGLGRGSTFTLTLPLISSTRGVRHTSSFEATSEAKPLSGLKVLAVDEQLDTRNLISTILRYAGAETIVAASAIEAYEKLREQRPDILLSDIGLPEENGYDFLRRVRALSPDEGGETPAIALTAWTHEEEKKKALRAGYSVHVAKPVDPDILVTTIANLARNSYQPARRLGCHVAHLSV